MRYIADLHVHSKYAAACSEQLTLDNINATARIKGINLIGTGDFTHPDWLREIKSKLTETSEGIYRLEKQPTNFVLSSEVCTIYNDKDGFKKIHNCILAPDIEVVESINDSLKKFANLRSDGRPMLSVKLSEFVEILHQIDKNIFVFPAHAWTPWYGVFGSFSGFDSMKEAYEDQAMHIHALETGLSSDPAMNWRVSGLDKYALLSGSDAHSLPKLGREATILEMDEEKLTYKELIERIIKKKLRSTVEFYPEEGKYHYDGHRKCGVSFSPEAGKKYNGICPVCRKRMTIGVMHRIGELADRELGEAPKGAVPFVHMVPLQEIISYISGKAVSSEYVKNTYTAYSERFGSEFNLLLDADLESVANLDKELASALGKIRNDKVNVIPGYDGVFGIIDLFDKEASKKKKGLQYSMADF